MTDRRFVNHQHLDSQGARMTVECRFCRHKEQYSKFDYVAPCGCIGPTRYVHRTCITNWFIVKFEHVYNQEYEGDPLQFNVFCQICQQKMEIEFSLIKKCSKYDEFVQKLEQDKLWFVLIVIIAIAAIAALVFICILNSITHNVDSNILTIVISICCLVLVTDIIAFFWKFTLIKSIEIDRLPNNKDPPKIMAYAEQDINEIVYEQEECQPHFGGGKKETIARDKSLMLESNRNSEGGGRSSVESKTFTDIIMKQMYKHDLPSDKDKISQYGDSLKPMSKKEIQQKNLLIEERNSKNIKISKKYNADENLPEKRDQGIQMTVLEEKNSGAYQRQRNIQYQDRSVQPSYDSNGGISNKFRSKRIFNHQQNLQNRQPTPASQAEEEKKQESQKVFNLKHSEQRFEGQRYNLIKQKGSDERFGKVNGNLMKQQVREQQKFNIIKQQPIGSVKSSDRTLLASKQSKLKLKSIKDPIKIKIRY